MKSPLLHLSSQQLTRHDKRAVLTPRRSLQTDYHYQTTAEAPMTASAAGRPASQDKRAAARNFRKLSETVVGAETRWQFAVEAAVLSVVAAIVAWSLVSLIIVLAQTAPG